MELLRTVPALGRWLADRRPEARVALVPTMGNLHAGHLELVHRARRQAECVVASLFVNPLQFGANEDFDRYPRTFADDRRRLHEAGADLLYAPAVKQVYPGGFPPATTVRVDPSLDGILCGAHRPGHFTGVATVVSILLNQVRPDVALFGEKDWQQLAVIRALVRDLSLGVRVVGVPTVRERDGLAMSSRNGYLSAAERVVAPKLYATLKWVAAQLRGGRRDFDALSNDGQVRLVKAGFNPQYLEIRRPSLQPAAPDDQSFRVLAAARLGTTRLIDNLMVRPVA